MEWYRMYASVVDDPKVQRLPPVLFRHWINALCLACWNGGALPPLDDVAFRFRTSTKNAAKILADLRGAELIDEDSSGRLRPHNWETRQYIGKNSTERVKTYREKVRSNGQTVGAYLKHRPAVFERDGNACVYCGATSNLCLDHMVPVSLGGDDDISNLACCCKACNSGKAGRTPEMAGFRILSAAALNAYRDTVARLRSATVARNTPEQNRTDSDTETDPETEQRRVAAVALYGLYDVLVAAWPDDDRREVDLGAQIWLSLVDACEIIQFQAVLDGLERWKGSEQWAKDGGKYRPSIAKWLQKRAWKDMPKQSSGW